MNRDGLGRVFNVVAVADDVYVPLVDARAVSFVCYLGAGDTYTVTSAASAAGASSAVLAVVDHFYDSTGVGGAWSERTQAAASTVVNDGTAGHDCSVFTIAQESLPDGHTHVKVASTSTGTVVAILHDLAVQRTPQNLPALV
jgi:hypothetical protein